MIQGTDDACRWARKYKGKLGVVEEGALADLLLVDGDPIANLELIADPAKDVLEFMKEGKVYKNPLQ